MITRDDLIVFEKQYAETITKLKQLNTELKSLKEQDANMREGLLKAMLDNDIDEFEVDGFHAKVVQGSTSTTLDTKALKKNNPDMYELLMGDYSKEVKRNKSVRIKIEEY